MKNRDILHYTIYLIFIFLSFHPARTLSNRPSDELQIYAPDSKSFNGRSENTIQAIIEDFKVNDDTGDWDHTDPSIAVDGSGNFVVVWQDRRNGHDGIYAQRFRSTGAFLGKNFKVNDNADTTSLMFPEVAMDESGSFVVVWQDKRNGNDDIYAQRLNSSGTPRGTNFRVNDDLGNSSQRDPSIDMNAVGDFVISWADFGTIPGIYAQRYSSFGTARGNNFRVSDPAKWGEEPSIALDQNGNFVVAWYMLSLPSFNDIYAQRYDSYGKARGNNFVVNDYLPSDQYFPSIAMDASGNFVVVWVDGRFVDFNFNLSIHGHRYSSAGESIGTDFWVNKNTFFSQFFTSVSMDAEGNCIVAWSSDGVRAQRYNAQGDAIDTNFCATKFTHWGQGYPKVKLQNQRIYLVWKNERQHNIYFDIWAKVLDWNSPVNSVEEDRGEPTPSVFYLLQNYPNPFNPSTTIEFLQKQSGPVKLTIYSQAGQEVIVLLDAPLDAGRHTVVWNGRDTAGRGVPGGLYILRIDAENFRGTKKMLLIK